MSERNAQTLADAFGQHLVDNQGHANLLCASTEEAAELAKELKRRGWKARAQQALMGNFEEMHVKPYVECTGKRRAQSAPKPTKEAP